MTERLEELAMQQDLAADAHKERMAKKIGIKIRMAGVQRCLAAWRDDVRNEKRQRLGEQMERAQAELVIAADEVKERMSRFMIRMTGRQQLHQVCPLRPPPPRRPARVL